MDATAILKISAPEQLFSKGEVEKEFKALAKQWHPDINKSPHSNDVFIHLSELYKRALERIAQDA